MSSPLPNIRSSSKEALMSNDNLGEASNDLQRESVLELHMKVFLDFTRSRYRTMLQICRMIRLLIADFQHLLESTLMDT
jgi:hypothetical protein